MPQKNKHVHAYVAMSPDALANALMIPTRKVRAAILAGQLPIYQHGKQRRVLLEDAIAWVRSWTRPLAPKENENADI
jgi:hypothetical protein